jgi:hypothetical protein
MKLKKEFFLIIVFSLAAALISGAVVYLLSSREIKNWKNIVGTLQEQVVNLEYQIDQYIEGSALGFHQISPNRYLGEAVVSGHYHMNGDGATCFKPDKESLSVLPENDEVQAFCFRAVSDQDKEKLVREFFGVDLQTALGDLPKYGYVDPARKATVQIQGYEIKSFNKLSRTGFTKLLQIVERK